ncbi:proteasome assembly chaperone 4, partial [Striga asiatica]
SVQNKQSLKLSSHNFSQSPVGCHQPPATGPSPHSELVHHRSTTSLAANLLPPARSGHRLALSKLTIPRPPISLKMDSNEIERVRGSINELSIKEQADQAEGSPQITCFSQASQASDEVTFHFQIIRLHNQIYAWVGCNTAKFGHLYADAPTRPVIGVTVTSLIGGASDNTGSRIARRLVLKTGLNIVLACNIPKNNPMLEANAEKMLMQKLISLGYTKSRS